VALLHDFYSGVVSKLLEASPKNDPVVGLLKHEVDYINMLSLLSGKLSGASHEQLLAQLIPNGIWQHEDKVRELIETKDTAALSVALRRFSKAGIFSALPERGDVTPSDIERAALRTLLREALKSIRSGVPTPASIIGSFIWIETEAFNLWAYVSAFTADVPGETIEAMLIHEGKTS
jgi:vacuolar-type H+-ATPase subunit C/Vma6